MTFEQMLKKVGVCGRYQGIVLTMMIMSKMYPGIITVIPVLAAGFMDHLCKLPPENSTDYSRYNITAYKCYLRYNDTLTGEVTDRKCSEWTYFTDKYISTIRSEFNLVCDHKYLAQLSTTVYFIGFMIGCALYGKLSDAFGRKKMILVAAIHLGVFALLSAFAPTFWMYAALRLFTGIGNGGLLVTLFAMTAEVTDQKVRTLFLMNVQNGWALGVCFLALVGYFVRNHVFLQVIMALSAVMLSLIAFLTYESPRWLYGTGRIAQADEVMKNIARINRKEIDESFTLQQAYDDMKKLESSSQNQTSFYFVFTYSGLRRVTLLVWWNWFVVSLGYFAMLFMLEGLGGNVYVNLVAMSLVELPARFTGLVSSIKLGRRISLSVSYGLGGICCIVCAFLYGKDAYENVVLGIAIAGQFFFTAAFDLIWMYSAEIFPTVIRNFGIGAGSAMARVAGMLAPQIGLLRFIYIPLPFLILGALPITASVGSLFLPETNRRTLAETIEDGERLVRRGTITWDRELQYRAKENESE